MKKTSKSKALPSKVGKKDLQEKISNYIIDAIKALKLNESRRVKKSVKASSKRVVKSVLKTLKNDKKKTTAVKKKVTGKSIKTKK